MSDRPTLIIGAGPTGAALTLLLARAGLPVILIEAASHFQRIFRGQALMPSGLEALAQLGLRETIETMPHQTLDAWEFWIEGKRLFRVEEPLEADGLPCTLVSQPALLTALVAEARTYLNCQVLQGTAVQDLLREGDRVIGVKLANGESLGAKLVIAADGRNSTMRQRAGLVLQPNGAGRTAVRPYGVNVLWFKLKDVPPVRDENVFHAILKGRHSFGFFQSAEGEPQIGWAIHPDDELDWKNLDWPEQLAKHSPDWLAPYFRKHAAQLETPTLFSVTVGLAPQWWMPGLLLLGDAAHPMSPIRAQGINMALRDAIVAAKHLEPLLQEDVETTRLDAALAQIQAEREPEIRRSQHLQAQELAQAAKLRNFPLLRWGASTFAPLVGPGVRWSWLQRQQQLRQGIQSL